MNTAAKGWDDDSDDGIPRKAKQLRVCTKQLCRHEATNAPPPKVRPAPRSCKAMVGAMTKSRIKKSRKRAMLRGVDAIVRGAAQIVRQSPAAKGMAGLIKSLRTN